VRKTERNREKDIVKDSPTRPSSLVSRRSRGFTLLEVLLAMAILAVIMTVIYASFSTAGRDVEQAETMRDETDLARALMTRLSTDIANAWVKPDPNRPTFFRAQKEELLDTSVTTGEKIRHDRIDLTTLTNGWPRLNTKETELWEVGYFFKEKPDGKGYSLYRREKRELSNDVLAGQGGEEYEITDRVETLRFALSSDGTNWTDNGWNSSVLPKTVDITIVLDNGKTYTTHVDVGNLP